jgi:hypothetical protein
MGNRIFFIFLVVIYQSFAYSPVLVIENHCCPSMSPDGKSIATFFGNDSIGIVKTDGSGFRLLTGAGGVPSWQKNGDLIAFRRSDSLYAINAVSNFLELLFVDDDDDFEEPVWNWKGDLIADEANYGIKLYSYSKKDTTHLNCVFQAVCFNRKINDKNEWILDSTDTIPCFVEFDEPSWAPNDSFIVGANLILVNTFTGEIDTSLMQDANEPEWSPNGKWITFVTIEYITAVFPPDYKHTLWVYDVEKRNLNELVIKDFSYYCNTTWSPNSDTLYFDGKNTVTGVEGIWKMPFDGNPSTAKLSITKKANPDIVSIKRINNSYLFSINTTNTFSEIILKIFNLNGQLIENKIVYNSDFRYRA